MIFTQHRDHHDPRFPSHSTKRQSTANKSPSNKYFPHTKFGKLKETQWISPNGGFFFIINFSDKFTRMYSMAKIASGNMPKKQNIINPMLSSSRRCLVGTLINGVHLITILNVYFCFVYVKNPWFLNVNRKFSTLKSMNSFGFEFCVCVDRNG